MWRLLQSMPKWEWKSKDDGRRVEETCGHSSLRLNKFRRQIIQVWGVQERLRMVCWCTVSYVSERWRRTLRKQKMRSWKEVGKLPSMQRFPTCKYTEYQRDWYPFVVENCNRVEEIGFRKRARWQKPWQTRVMCATLGPSSTEERYRIRS